MAEYENNNINNTPNNTPPKPPDRPPDRAVNVTKPQQDKLSNSAIDASRVSAHTLREEQALEKLKRQIGNINQKENRSGKIKTIVAIILIIVLIVLAIAFIAVIGKNTNIQEENYDVKLSMQIENKSAFSIITDTGREQLREIHPGDRLPVKAYMRNSEDYRGDAYTGDRTPPNIYVRFKLVLVLDYQERYDILIPTMSNKWYRYNEEDESKIIGGVTSDDKYYYYLGAVTFLQRVELFSELEFSGDAITCDDGGKYGQVQVFVESVEANINSITSDSIWPTAPKYWVTQMAIMEQSK